MHTTRDDSTLSLTTESFDTLLGWLSEDRENAGKRYVEIRQRLVRIFSCRGCKDPEDLADETINRVVMRLKEIQRGFEGDPARYFYGVANKVHLEYLRRTHLSADEHASKTIPPKSVEYDCLEKCLDMLPDENRALILEYYQVLSRNKTEGRRKLAEELGIGVNALRIRAHRVRTHLDECIRKCMGE